MFFDCEFEYNDVDAVPITYTTDVYTFLDFSCCFFVFIPFKSYKLTRFKNGFKRKVRLNDASRTVYDL